MRRGEHAQAVELGHRADFFRRSSGVKRSASARLFRTLADGRMPRPCSISDMCYVKDGGRAIALLQMAERLNHTTYNVGSGRPTTIKEVVAAIKRVIQDAQIELPKGHDPNGPGRVYFLDTTRLQRDTGYAPAYDIERGVADYTAWLRSGHER